MEHYMSVQWHITTDCQNRCKHCYVFDEKTYKNEKEGTLSLEEKFQILDQLDILEEKYDIHISSICIMGGDPLLSKDFFPLAQEIVRRGKTLSMGGNPDCLTDENLEKLRDLKICSYQISLDGLEETHDLMRRKGSFQASVEGYEKLEKYGIQSSVMATLTPLNVDEFFELIDFVFYKTKADGFAFDFVSKVGEGKGFEWEFTPEEVLELSKRYLQVKEEYQKINPEFSFGEKPGVMRLLHMEQGTFLQPQDNGETAAMAGCLIGNNCIPILSDGTILSCRRFPEILGKLPQDTIEDILLGNETLKKYRRPQFWEKCSECIGWNFCRGCPAISYGESKNPFKPYSLCFAHLLDMDTHQEHMPISMDTTYEEEAALIKAGIPTQYIHDRREKQLSKTVPDIVGKLLTNEEYRAEFRKDTDAFFQKECPELSYQQRQYIIFRYNYLIMMG